MAVKRGVKLVEVQLGDASKLLLYDANSLCELEDLLGKSFSELFAGEDAIRKLGFREVRALLWAGLKGARGGNGAQWRLEQVGALMQPSELPAYLKSIAEALRVATTGKAEPIEEDPDADPTTPAETPGSGPGIP